MPLHAPGSSKYFLTKLAKPSPLIRFHLTYKQQPAAAAAAADSSTHDYLETGRESAQNIILESDGQSHADSRKAQQKHQSPGEVGVAQRQRHEFELSELRKSAQQARVRGIWWVGSRS